LPLAPRRSTALRWRVQRARPLPKSVKAHLRSGGDGSTCSHALVRGGPAQRAGLTFGARG
jgi:hypothetical protein